MVFNIFPIVIVYLGIYFNFFRNIQSFQSPRNNQNIRIEDSDDEESVVISSVSKYNFKKFRLVNSSIKIYKRTAPHIVRASRPLKEYCRFKSQFHGFFLKQPLK